MRRSPAGGPSPHEQGLIARPVSGRWWVNGVARVTYVLVGVVYGLGVVGLSSLRGSDAWPIWAALAVSLTGVSGAVFGYGLARLEEIADARHPVRPRWSYIGRSYGPVIGMAVVAWVVADQTRQGVALITVASWAGPLLVVFAGLTAVPVVAGLSEIFERARMVDGDSPGQRAESVLELRRLSTGLLAALGSQVTLATLALGAAQPSPSDQQSAIVLIFGAAWSAVIAIAYTPASVAVRAAARQICREAVPLDQVAQQDLPARADERRKLGEALGAEHSPIADLQSGILVVSPLLAGAVSLFLPD